MHSSFLQKEGFLAKTNGVTNASRVLGSLGVIAI